MNQEAGSVGVEVLLAPESEILVSPNPTDGKIVLSNLPSGTSSLLMELYYMDSY